MATTQNEKNIKKAVKGASKGKSAAKTKTAAKKTTVKKRTKADKAVKNTLVLVE